MDPLNPFDDKDERGFLQNTRQNLSGYALVAVVLLLIVLIRQLSPPETESNSNCLASESTPASVALLIDGTDPFSLVQAERIHQELQKLLFQSGSLQSYTKVSIYVAQTSDDSLIQPRFVRCIPEVDSSIMTGNPNLTKVLWDNNFRAPIDSVLSEIIRDSTVYSESPILESIQQVTLVEQRTNVTSGRTLIVISDFLQNSPAISHYTDTLPNPDLLSSSSTRHLHNDMSDWKVVMYYVVRNGAQSSLIQARSHQDHWMEVFRYFSVPRLNIEMHLIAG